MGGAPPPPLGAAPQAPKIRKNSALLGAGFGRFAGSRIAPSEGVSGGYQPATRSGHLGRLESLRSTAIRAPSRPAPDGAESSS